VLVSRHKLSHAESETAGLIVQAFEPYKDLIGKGLRAAGPVALAKAAAILARKGLTPAAVSAALEAYAKRAVPPDPAVVGETLRAVHAGQDEAAWEERCAHGRGSKRSRKREPR